MGRRRLDIRLDILLGGVGLSWRPQGPSLNLYVCLATQVAIFEWLLADSPSWPDIVKFDFR